MESKLTAAVSRFRTELEALAHQEKNLIALGYKGREQHEQLEALRASLRQLRQRRAELQQELRPKSLPIRQGMPSAADIAAFQKSAFRKRKRKPKVPVIVGTYVPPADQLSLLEASNTGDIDFGPINAEP
jgi:hypothetical protein